MIQRLSHLRYIKRFHICAIQEYWPVSFDHSPAIEIALRHERLGYDYCLRKVP
jgi:hypothetical protein